MAASGRQRTVGLATSIIQMGVLLSLAVLYVRFNALETRLSEHIRSTRNDAHQGEIGVYIHSGDSTNVNLLLDHSINKSRISAECSGGHLEVAFGDAKCWPRE